MLKFSIFRFLSVLMITFFTSTSANAAPVTIKFSGSITDIFIDNGSARYSGLSIGDAFTGGFTYGSIEADATLPAALFPSNAYWEFDGGAFGANITNGIIPTDNSFVEIAMTNKDSMDIETASFLNPFTSVDLSAGWLFDEWGASTFSNSSNIGFGISLISVDASFYSNLSYQSIPPATFNNDIAVFYIQELDVNGNLIFETFGTLNTVSSVPLPAAFWLFVSGLAGIIPLFKRRCY